MKIYTKTGDKGKTSLFDGTRVRKDNIRVDTYGNIDELNSFIGIVIADFEDKSVKTKDQKYRLKIKDILLTIQSDLLTIGAELANPTAKSTIAFEQQLEKHIAFFEQSIDEMTNQLPELTNFILPGGGKAGALLQFARTVCRRVERRIITLSQEELIDQYIIKYFNRLSDLFFTISRYINFKEGITETIWRK